MKEIELGSGYRLVRRDAMNWELQQWREPAPDCGGRVAKSREAKWRGLDAAYELSLRDGDGRADLHAAMVEAERIAATLTTNVNLLKLGDAE